MYEDDSDYNYDYPDEDDELIDDAEDYEKQFYDTSSMTGRPEITAFTRVGPPIEDPWITKMTNLPKIFNKFTLSVVTLGLLRKSNLNCESSFVSAFTFTPDDILKSLNPIALSLSHYVRTDKGEIDKNKLNEISKILNSDKSCNSDKDCKSTTHNTCKSGKCISNIIDLGSIFRYLQLWNQVYQKDSIHQSSDATDTDTDSEEELNIN